MHSKPTNTRRNGHYYAEQSFRWTKWRYYCVLFVGNVFVTAVFSVIRSRYHSVWMTRLKGDFELWSGNSRLSIHNRLRFHTEAILRLKSLGCLPFQMSLKSHSSLSPTAVAALFTASARKRPQQALPCRNPWTLIYGALIGTNMLLGGDLRFLYTRGRCRYDLSTGGQRFPTPCVGSFKNLSGIVHHDRGICGMYLRPITIISCGIPKKSTSFYVECLGKCCPFQRLGTLELI